MPNKFYNKYFEYGPDMRREASKHLAILDAIQGRAIILIVDPALREALDSLVRSRSVSALSLL